MKIEELFPNVKVGRYGLDDAPSYEQIVESFGYETVVGACLGSYQGDLLWLLRDGDRCGVLSCGYGSCSGCDRLYGCETIADLQDVFDGLYTCIEWKGTREETIQWLLGEDWKLKYWGDANEVVEEFIGPALKALGHGEAA